MSLGDFLEGVGDVLTTGLQQAPNILTGLARLEQARSGGFGGFGGGLPFQQAGLGDLLQQLPLPGSPLDRLTSSSGQCAAFMPTRGRARAIPELRAVNPQTGKIESWVHRGSPLIWSGDRACAKRYAKQAGFTLKRRGSSGRTTRRTTRRR